MNPDGTAYGGQQVPRTPLPGQPCQTQPLPGEDCAVAAGFGSSYQGAGGGVAPDHLPAPRVLRSRTLGC